MRVLLTGGCGFVGVNLLSYFRKLPAFECVVLDNLSLGRREYIADFQAEFVEGDIRDVDLVNELASRVDAIVHLAAETRVLESIADPDLNFAVNVAGTYNLLRAAVRNGHEIFVLASTGGAIIGNAEPPMHENLVPRPASPYGASKACAEAYCSAFAQSYDLNSVCLRFSNVYGPNSFHKGSVVATFFRTILAGKDLTVFGDGTQTRDFVFAEDLCLAIHRALGRRLGHEVFQLGSGVETSVNALISYIRDVVGSDSAVEVVYKPKRKGEIQRSFSDISRAVRDLGYGNLTELPLGLSKTWRWFQERAERC